jgi:hypothetical protein
MAVGFNFLEADFWLASLRVRTLSISFRVGRHPAGTKNCQGWFLSSAGSVVATC